MACVRAMRQYIDKVLDPACVGERTLTMDKSFNMQKGDIFFLPANLTSFPVGLGWTTKSGKALDLDASCILLRDVDNDGDLDPVGAVYFLNKKEPGIMSSGDNVSGDGQGDDEIISVDLGRVQKEISALAFVVNIYSSGASFSDITQSYVRLFDNVDGHEFARFTLAEHLSSQGVIFCVVYRGTKPDEAWSVFSVGEECQGQTCMDITTKLWDGSLRNVNNLATTSAQEGGGGCCTVC